MKPELQPWKTLSRTPLCRPNRFLAVEMHAVQLPDGRRIDDWPWLVTPDYANVLAETEEGRFLFFRQTKYAVEVASLAPVGGFLEPGEDRLAGIQRELLEETGYAAPEWHDLGTYVVDANRGAGKAHLFFARGARYVQAPVADDLEEQEPVQLTATEVAQALDSHQFKVLAWSTVVALGLAKRAALLRLSA